jgi:hypothetical protein
MPWQRTACFPVISCLPAASLRVTFARRYYAGPVSASGTNRGEFRQQQITSPDKAKAAEAMQKK